MGKSTNEIKPKIATKFTIFKYKYRCNNIGILKFVSDGYWGPLRYNVILI